jgi:hypothetical protein
MPMRHALLLFVITHSFADGKPLTWSTGFFIDWNDETKFGKILTSANIICSKFPSVHDRSGRRKYAADAQVRVLLSLI